VVKFDGWSHVALEYLDAVEYPADDGNGHGVAERLVAGAVGCGFAAILDQRVIVAEALQALAFARR